jgi:hypothetical protein
MRERKESLETTVMQHVFVLNGIMHVPHYQKPGVFVGPGRDSPERSASQLMMAGAIPKSYPLWPRAKDKSCQ